VDTPAERQIRPGVGAAEREARGIRKTARIAVGRSVEHHHRRTGRELDPVQLGPDASEPEVPLHRALESQALLDEPRDELSVLAQLVLEGLFLGDVPEDRSKKPYRCLLAGREEVGRYPDDVDHLRGGPVGKPGLGDLGQQVVARVTPAVLDVLGEPGVQELESHRALIAEVVEIRIRVGDH
jgi:hypothetical protein